MASKSEQLLVVLSVLQGRHFPKSPRHQLVVQARFDGEQLATDPVEHKEQPQFSTELAWELDRKTLHQHRLQRTPIKLQCFAISTVTSAWESVGYVVLDLRSAQEVKQAPKWCTLLSSKYTKLKPALLLSLALENDSRQTPEHFKAKDAPPRQGSPLLTNLKPAKLEAVLNEDEGYHQIGPTDCCSDFFVLSVTVAFASKLEQLVPSTTKLFQEGSDLFFYYTLLGNDITSEPFQNLVNPNFEPERASVRVRSSAALLQLYLSQESTLQVHLCCGNHSLASTDVPLAGLVKPGLDLDKQPATVEGAFVLVPPNRAKQKLPSLPTDLQPTVGVSLTVRKEAVNVQLEDAGMLLDEPQAPVRKMPLSPRSPHSPVLERGPLPSVSPRRSPVPGHASPTSSMPHLHTDSEVESLLEDPVQAPPIRPGSGPPDGLGDPPREPNAPASSVSVSKPKMCIPSSAHHYCFSMDLRSIRDVDVGFPVNCILRYSYQFFRSAAPITTSPPVEVQKNMEVYLPKSYCTFEFATLPHQLQETFSRIPLVVEMWHREQQVQDLLLGTATIQLSQLLTAEKIRFTAQSGQHWRQTVSHRVPVLRTQGPGVKVAELNCVITLEDLGLVRIQDIEFSETSQSATHGKRQSGTLTKPAENAAGTPTEPRQTLEYKAAMELEVWKELQEDLFDDQLHQKEQKHMRSLGEDWRKRDRERGALVNKKEMEYNVLEEQLQKTLADLEKREKQLAHAEMETRTLQREMRAEHEFAVRELQDSGRRLREDCLHQVELERSKVRQLEEERSRLLSQIHEAESRYKQLEKEFQLYREQQNMRPEIRLQSELNLLNLEKVELERKLESSTKSKLHYKQQWGRALKELARFKQREQETAMLRLKKQQQELEHMRLRFLAAEEEAAVKADKQQLEEIRNELNRLKQQQEKWPPAERAQEPPRVGNADEHLSRLLEERDTLLRTGVYTHDDRIISELDRQIREAMTHP